MTIEEIMNIVVEKGMVGAGFIYLLYMFTTKFTKSQEDIVGGLSKMSETLIDVSNTMKNLDERVKALEEKE